MFVFAYTLLALMHLLYLQFWLDFDLITLPCIDR
jgi:hypothetical protein